jgi:subtilisin family serine protease
LVAQGVTIINHSAYIIYDPDEGPGNGTGTLNNVVTTAVNRGVFWVNAAGNTARGHRAGTWNDPNGNSAHNFPDGSEFLPVIIPPNTTFTVALRWGDGDQSWANETTDYDLRLWDNNTRTGVEVAVGNRFQTGTATSTPVESFSFTPGAVGPPENRYYLEIVRFNNPNPPPPAHTLELLVHENHELPDPVALGSLAHPADNASAGMAAIGALVGAGFDTIDPFSAQGPTSDGRIKPDIAAPSGVSTVSRMPFPRTSSATPHVAGAAALVKQAFPGFTPAQLKNLPPDARLRSGERWRRQSVRGRAPRLDGRPALPGGRPYRSAGRLLAAGRPGHRRHRSG